MDNPFRYGQVVDGEHFCPRPVLQKQLESFIRAGQNAVVTGERRMGKTSLVLAAAGRVRGLRTLYADLLGIRSAADFCRRVAAGAGRLERGDSLLRKTCRLLSRLRPTVTFDRESGVPVLSVDARSSDPEESVEAVFDMIEAHGRSMKLCVVFDEFQDVLRMENHEPLVALMRSRIQFMGDVPFLFTGSVRNDMVQLFRDSRSPFFKSALPFEVGAIPDGEFVPFLAAKFAAGGRKADESFLRLVLDEACRTTGDVQELCEALWQVTDRGRTLDRSDIERAFVLLHSREGTEYERSVSLLTGLQLRVLAAVARIGGASVQSAEFVREAGASSAVAAKKAVLRLVALDLLFCHDGEYKFTNPFFRHWVLKKSL